MIHYFVNIKQNAIENNYKQINYTFKVGYVNKFRIICQKALLIQIKEEINR